jgi:hypothetical protein
MMKKLKDLDFQELLKLVLRGEQETRHYARKDQTSKNAVFDQKDDIFKIHKNDKNEHKPKNQQCLTGNNRKTVKHQN